MKSKFILLNLIITCIVLTTKAQNFEWVKQLGGTGQEICYSVTTDSIGNVYTTGHFEGTVDFDPGPGTFYLTSVGNQDIFISKLNAQGTFLWAIQLGGTGEDYGKSITTDSFGNLLIIGYFDGTADFDPGPGFFNLTSIGNEDIFISKIDSTGNFLWVKQVGGSSSDAAKFFSIDDTGNIYITGNFSGTSDFDPGASIFNLTSTSSAGDIFISKLDSSGNFLWAKQIAGTGVGSGTGFGSGYSITTNSSGVYTTGYFYNTVDFDPGPNTFNLTSSGAEEIFISKLDHSGNFLWAKQLGGTGDDYGWSINSDSSGNVYTTGFFLGTADFDPGPSNYNLTSAGESDIFISKLDALGNFLWAKRIGGTDSDEATCIFTDSLGYLYITGYFEGTVDFDPGPGFVSLTSAGNEDIFISKLNASGNFLWTKQMGGTNSDIGLSIATDVVGNIYTAGIFQGNADFNPWSGTFSLNSTGDYDVFIHKLSQIVTGIVKNDFGKQFRIYPNPGRNNQFIDLGITFYNLTVIVRNYIGMEIMKKSYDNVNHVELMIEGAPGSYFVEIYSDGKKSVLKVIKD